LSPIRNAKIYRTIKPEKAQLRWDQRGIFAVHVCGAAVLEYGPTEILPPVGAKWKAMRVSADRVARPAAHTRAESRDSQPSKGDAGERRTCMGLFLSSGCFWVLLPVLCSERERPFFIPSPAIRFPERAEGVKGPKR